MSTKRLQNSSKPLNRDIARLKTMSLSSARNTPLLDRLLFLASRWTPKLSRVLLIESGSRGAADKFLTELYSLDENEQVDVLTCYPTPPAPFNNAKGTVLFTHQAQGHSGRTEIFKILANSGYSAVCVLCTGDRIMTKWKWVAALRIPAKVMIVNENADSFWLDRGHLRNIRQMALVRSGLAHLTMAPFRMMAHALAFPITLAILLGFAGYMKGRRFLRGL
jgi:hypothetical protein